MERVTRKIFDYIAEMKRTITRKRLHKDLHPSVLKAIEADKAQFPNLYKSIITDIQDADVVTDLNLGTANYLREYHIATRGDFSSNDFVLNIYEVFGK